MDRGRKSPAGDFARAAASGVAAAGLSGVARGSEWQGGDAPARGDKQRDDPGAVTGNAAHYGTVGADSGSNLGQRCFTVERVDAACAVERWWPEAAFCKSLNRAEVGNTGATRSRGGFP